MISYRMWIMVQMAEKWVCEDYGCYHRVDTNRNGVINEYDYVITRE